MLSRIRAALLRRAARRMAISVVVVVYRMPEQADRTLHSLSRRYQRGLHDEPYEVIVVENDSDRRLGGAAVTRHGPEFRYYLRDDGARSPVPALDFGARQARAPTIGLMIDGARLVTPGILRNVLRARRMADVPVVSVPGYHLGREIQQEAVDSGYGPDVEMELLEGIGWPTDGYALFDIACLSGSCAGGFFKPFAESNCLFMPRRFFFDIGGIDPAFDLPGGGNANLDLYRRACDDPRSTLIVLPGEGSFHQFHGGVTTNRSKRSPERRRMMERLNEQYLRLRGEPYRAPGKSAVFLGEIPDQAQRFVAHSAEQARKDREPEGSPEPGR